MNRPFTIFSWHEPFLPTFLRYICEHTDNMPGESIIIFPHDRPRRYLIELLRQYERVPKPTLLPRMLTMHEVINLFCAQNSTILQDASLLDQVYILHQAVNKTAQDDDIIGQYFARMDLANFLPWGTRLAALFEEYMLELQTVENIHHAEGEVSAQAAVLLSSLSKIHNNYLSLLKDNLWTTPGLNALNAATQSDIPPMFTSQDNKHIFIAGFLAPHRAEQKILKTLWQNGAHICLHSDPHLPQHKALQEIHWSCHDHVAWVNEWQCTCQSYTQDPSSQGLDNQAQKYFFSGYDVHSQLLEIKELLRKQNLSIPENNQSTAIVLTAPSLLMPMLHHLPDQEFNVSMGYPLAKSPLFALLDAITSLHTSSIEDKQNVQYYWRNLLHCLRHPYIQMLKTLPAVHDDAQDQDGKMQPIRHILHQMEHALRQGSRYVELKALCHEHTENCPPAERELVSDIITSLGQNFANINTPLALAQALMNLCQLLLNHGQGIWESSPLDAEAIYRLVQRVIPTLKASSMAHEVLPKYTLFSLMQHLMQAERVPFEADPITGLQVLGLLETRLLHFEKLIIVDATDDILPGFAAQDPLLPDALRQTLGLLDTSQRERHLAHILHRLMAQAKEIHFFWQEGVGRSSLFDGKKSRSRFIDAAIWKEEQQLGYIIKNGDDPLRVAPCVISPMAHNPNSIEVTDIIRKKIHDKLMYGISPTRLDSYIQCPQRFAWENIYKFSPLEEVTEGYDPLIVGNLLHKILYLLYEPFKGKKVQQGHIDTKLILTHFESCFEKEKLEQKLPPDALIMLRMAVPMRLKKFLHNQPDLTHIVSLEEELLTTIAMPQGHNFKLKGRVDRVDKRFILGEQQLIILDYKTGKLPQIKYDVWDDDSLWQDITTWTPQVNDGNDLLKQITESFESVQLPCYMHICRNNYKEPIFDAAWVDLASSGEEHALLKDEHLLDWRSNIIKKQIPSLLQFILNHMTSSSHFSPHEGKHCKYCPYGALCAN